jgi:hypothetical protein
MSFIQKKPGKAESLQYQYYDGRLSPLVIPHLQVGDYLQSQIIPFTRTGYVWRETHAKLLKEGAMDAYASNWPTPTPTLIPTVTPTGSASAAPSPMPTAPKSAEEELATAPYWPQDRLQNSVKFMINKWLHTGDFGTQYVDENRKDLEELIRYSERKKWKSVIISIPISQLFMDELGPSFMKAYVDEPLKNALLVGGEFIDFSSYRNFRENAYLFSNADHLNYYGANIFSHLLLERLNEKGYLPNEANGY